MPRPFQSELRSMHVVGANGRVFGQVEDLMIDEVTLQTTAVIILVSADAVLDLGIEKPFWSRARLSVPVHHVAEAADALVLRTSLEEFAQLLSGAADAD